MAINSVVLTGRITADIDLKHTQGGKAYCKFSIAVNRRYNREETDFFTIIAWEKRAELAATHLSKGSLIGVTGSIRTRSYEDDNGVKRKVTEVLADNIEFLDSRKSSNESHNDNNSNSNNSVESDNDFPF